MFGVDSDDHGRDFDAVVRFLQKIPDSGSHSLKQEIWIGFLFRGAGYDMNRRTKLGQLLGKGKIGLRGSVEIEEDEVGNILRVSQFNGFRRSPVANLPD